LGIDVDMTESSVLEISNEAITQLKLLVTPLQSALESELAKIITADSTLAIGSGSDYIPEGFHLSNAFPNPFNPSTEIVYSLSAGSNVDLSIYDILGRKISTLVAGYHEPNRYRAVWNGTDEKGFQVPAGVYFYKMSTQDYSDVKKIILLK